MPGWRVRLGIAAELDFANILKWTTENFGKRQALIYRDVLVEAMGALAQDGPEVYGAKSHDDILQGLRTLHIARHGRRGRHILLFRVAQGRIIEIGRILHDSMEIERHLSFGDDDSTNYE